MEGSVENIPCRERWSWLCVCRVGGITEHVIRVVFGRHGCFMLLIPDKQQIGNAERGGR